MLNEILLICMRFMLILGLEQPAGLLAVSIKYRAELILDYSCIFNQVEKSSTSALHRTPDPSTLPAPPSEPTLINVTSTSVTLAWNKVQLKQGSSSFIGYTVEYFSADLRKGWVLAVQRVPSNVVTVGLNNYANCSKWDGAANVQIINFIANVLIDDHHLMVIGQ